MIVLYTQFNKKLDDRNWTEFLSILPDDIQTRISKYRKWQDRQATLFGKLLLRKGLIKYAYPIDCLNEIKVDSNRRPYMNKKIDFNISHSGNYVVCVIARKARVGIDIEKIKTIDISYYKESFHPRYWQEIHDDKGTYKTFYKHWTKIESIVKADGRGLTIQIKKIFTKNNRIILDGKKWFTKELNINDNYSCHVTANIENLPISLSEVVF